MRGAFIGIGLTMLLAASTLSYLGHYDGVLGTTDSPVAASSAAERPTITVRGTVVGDSGAAASALGLIQSNFAVPDDMRQLLSRGEFVLFRFPDRDRGTVQTFLLADQGVPDVGTTLIVTGILNTQWTLVESSQHSVTSVPVVFLEPRDYHEPLLFKG